MPPPIRRLKVGYKLVPNIGRPGNTGQTVVFGVFSGFLVDLRQQGLGYADVKSDGSGNLLGFGFLGFFGFLFGHDFPLSVGGLPPGIGTHSTGLFTYQHLFSFDPGFHIVVIFRLCRDLEHGMVPSVMPTIVKKNQQPGLWRVGKTSIHITAISILTELRKGYPCRNP